MRRIEKRGEPPCLEGRRQELARICAEQGGRKPENRDWNPSGCAGPMRAALVAEQRGLCAYCMQTISPHGPLDYPAPQGNGGTRIEHFLPREDYAEDMYEWSNLLGACVGYYGRPGHWDETCDRAKKATLSPVHPCRFPPDVAALFTYRRAGTSSRLLLIESADAGGRAAIEVLNLNAQHLAERRREVQVRISREIAKQKDVRRQKSLLGSLLVAFTEPDARGTLPAFAPIGAQYVRRKLEALGGQR